MDYLTIEVVPPYDDPEIPEAGPERNMVFRLLGLIRCAHQAVLKCQERLDAGDPIADDLAYQLEQTLEDAQATLGQVYYAFTAGALEAKPHEKEWAEQEQQALQKRTEAQGRVIVAGENRIPPQHGTFATTADGRSLSVTNTVGCCRSRCVMRKGAGWLMASTAAGPGGSIC